MKKVLVVDDERLVTQSIAKNLHELGYEVIEAHSLEEVKELIANNVFDILITDTSFGVVTDETGLEIAKLFKQQFIEGKIIATSNEERTCWNRMNSNLFVHKIALSNKKSLEKILSQVG